VWAMKRFRGARLATWVLAALVTGLAVIWGALALYFSAPGSATARAVVGVVFVVAMGTLIVWVRPRRLGWPLAGALFAAVLVWWLLIPARNDRDWQPDLAQLAWAEVQGDTVTVHNVRNTVYRSDTDFDVHYEDRTYRLSDVRSLDFLLSHWGAPGIAHTILSFGFADGRYLAVSIEGRKEKGEGYSAIKGLFKQYELIFVVADERDLIGVRTNVRGEHVYLYRLRTPPSAVRELFLRYIAELNRLREQPEWYNAITQNCTTAIRGLTAPVATRSWRGWKIYLNGYLDELAYEIGAVDPTLPFAELHARSLIDDRARGAAGAPDFSRRIREGLPGMGGS
jgi:Domain of unknown function (DUF4105)